MGLLIQIIRPSDAYHLRDYHLEAAHSDSDRFYFPPEGQAQQHFFLK